MHTGDIVRGRFEIERLAEKGGMGAVFRARDRTTGQPVALKVLHAFAMGEKSRLVSEARALMKLRHPGVVRYVDHGLCEDERPYLAMEWLDGEDLRQRMRRQELRVADVIALGYRVAEALAHAHAAGIVHRDIKPSNLFLLGGQAAQIKVIDFGVARVPEPARDATALGAVLGTIAYMAPEQARGSREVTAGADVFSLGCVLFEGVTGQRAFSGEDVMAVLAKVLVTDVPRARAVNPRVPRALDRLISKMLAKDALDRPTAVEVARALDGLVDRTASTSGDTSTDTPPTAMRVPTLTGGERRLASVVVVRGAPGEHTDEDDESVSKTLVDSEIARLQQLFSPFDARLEQLADGTRFAIVAGKGAAQDQALVAAQCALALRGEFAQAAMSLVTGSGEVSGGQWVGEVLERAASLMRTEERSRKSGTKPASGAAIRIDDVTAVLLGARATIETDEHGASLVALRTEEAASRTLLGKPTPFVGRERELTLLQSTLAECAAEPVTRAVIVTAPPGGGKSRLLRELLARAPASTDVWIARGDPMSHKSPFGMLLQIVRRIADLRDNEPLSAQREKLTRRVGRNVEPGEVLRIAEFLGEIVGVPFPDEHRAKLRSAREDTMLMGDQMRRAWEDFVQAECEEHPILLVLEDLHWGDVPTVKMVDALLRQGREKPLFVLILARPGALAGFPGMFRGNHVMELSLPDLSRKASERLAREALGEAVAPAAIARLAERAGGNAFLLEELIRAAAEGRGDEVPGTVLAMVRARLENMENDARRLLRAGSVFGASFWQAGVEALLGVAPKAPEVVGWLQELVEREVIVPREHGRFAGEEEYAFRHAIVREASYAMLTDVDKTLGHQLAGEWLARAGERDAATLALHFERGGQSARAVAFYLRAAEQGLEGNDLEAALACVDRGLSCGAGAEASGSFHLIAAEAYRFKGEPAREQAAALAAMALLPRGDTQWCIAAGQAAIASGKLGDRARLEAIAQDLIDLAAEGRFSGRLVVAAARASIPLLLGGLRGPAEELLVHVNAHGDRVAWSDPGVAAWIHLARGTHAAELGEPAAALAHMKDAVAKFEDAGDVRGACAQSTNVAWTSLEMGENERAEQVLRTGIAQASALGLAHVVSNARIHLGVALARRGELDEAETSLIEAVAVFRAGDNQRMETVARRALAEVYLMGGDLVQAETEALRAAAIAELMPPIRAHALATLADVLRHRGRASEALAAAQEAAQLLAAQGHMVQGEAGVRAALVEALEAAGHKDEALESLTEAHAWLSLRAERIEPGAAREKFLHAVPDHARIVALWDAWAAGWAPGITRSWHESRSTRPGR
jgi:serine/threonine protein kinase/tetratricopeptide (TPR) repeat protein